MAKVEHSSEKTDRWYKCGVHVQVGGVCSGLAEHLSVDRNLVRILAFVLLLFTWPLALLAYLIAYIVIPWRPDVPTYRPWGAVLILVVGLAAMVALVVLLR